MNYIIGQKLSEKYDYFIAGSDQVWNPYLEYCTEANFLTFAESLQKIAISPSIAIEEIPERNKEDFSKWIRDFRLLSVTASEYPILKMCILREKMIIIFLVWNIFLPLYYYRGVLHW